MKKELWPALARIAILPPKMNSPISLDTHHYILEKYIRVLLSLKGLKNKGKMINVMKNPKFNIFVINLSQTNLLTTQKLKLVICDKFIPN